MNFDQAFYNNLALKEAEETGNPTPPPPPAPPSQNYLSGIMAQVEQALLELNQALEEELQAKTVHEDLQRMLHSNLDHETRINWLKSMFSPHKCNPNFGFETEKCLQRALDGHVIEVTGAYQRAVEKRKAKEEKYNKLAAAANVPIAPSTPSSTSAGSQLAAGLSNLFGKGGSNTMTIVLISVAALIVIILILRK